MAYPKQIWDQLKSTTCEHLIAALEKDGFMYEARRGATQRYTHPDGRRAVIHYHRGGSYGPNLLKDLIRDVEWKEGDLRRLKLIK